VNYKSAFSGFAVSDLNAAREFYADVLRIDVEEENGMLILMLDEGTRPTLIYPKPDHEPATYTILNFEIEDIDEAVDELMDRGVDFELYDGFGQDERGVMRTQGPPIAWFRDPSGNILALIESSGSAPE